MSIPVQLARHGEPAVSRRPRLGDVLVSCGLLTDEQLHEALLVQREAEGGRRRRLGQIIVDKGFLTEQQLAQAFADLLGLEFVDLARQHLDPDVVRMLPRQVAERTKMLVIARTADSGGDGHKGTGIGGFGGHGAGLTVAAADPTNVVALDDVRVYTGATALNVVVCTQSQIRERIAQAWALGDADADAGAVADEVDPLAGGLNDADLVTAADQAPTVRLASSILADAVRVGASDIHVEPQADGMRIRYRVDGLLRPIRRVPRSAAAALVSRLKIVSGLDIAERRLPQDGRARLHVDGVAIDARVSTLPSVHGEKVVVRLLASGESVPPVAQLGLEVNQLEAVLAASLAPQGLLLITGPTGSGKTHTLYSLLSHIATPEKNVVTLEDPVEIQMPGITQVQIKHRTGLTFARGLRSVLRQDPDVVLVGEVRDTETAELALQASLTGHLVLTTLHTNDAVAALTRVVDMGVQPFLLASSLSLVVAQRLVRRPCRDCAAPYRPSERMLTLLGLTAADIADTTPMRGRGCAACGNTGYRGRTGIFEVLPVTASVRSVLLRTPTEAALGAAARAAGMTTLRASALARARRGETTFEEVLRVTHVDIAGGRRCSACDRALADDMIACPWCVTVLDRGHCVSCARPLESGWKICPWCRTPATAPPGDTQPATCMRRPRLLFVGQNESFRASIRSAVDKKMDVDTAITADAALAVLGRNDYDGVIVQQSLPDLAGLELLRMLRTNAETAALPLMLVRGAGTDVTEPENPVLLSRAGLDDVLTMPADDDAVRARLVALADRSPHSRQLGEVDPTATAERRRVSRPAGRKTR